MPVLGNSSSKSEDATYSEPGHSIFSSSSSSSVSGPFSATTDLNLRNGARIARYQVLQGYGNEDAAMELLRQVGREVKGVMKGRGWFCPLLLEFNGAPGSRPADRQLLGMNSNGGERIYLRLRQLSSTDVTRPLDSFLPIEEVVSTMLHELAHNLRGPHDDIFQRTLDQLHEEYFESRRQRARNGGRLDGEGFESVGNRLGGWQGAGGLAQDPTIRNVGKRAAEEAERRRHAQMLMAGGHGGAKLGNGSTSHHHLSPREEAVAAATRRLRLEQQCPSTTKERQGAVRWHEEEEMRHGVKVITILDDDEDDDGGGVGLGNMERTHSVAPRVRVVDRRQGHEQTPTSTVDPKRNKASNKCNNRTTTSRTPSIQPRIVIPISDSDSDSDIATRDEEDFEEISAMLVSSTKRPRVQGLSRGSSVSTSSSSSSSSTTTTTRTTRTTGIALPRESVAAQVALKTYREMQLRRRRA